MVDPPPAERTPGRRALKPAERRVLVGQPARIREHPLQPGEEWPNGSRARTDRPSASMRRAETLETHMKEQTEMNRALLLADRMLLKGTVLFSVALTAMTWH